MRIILGVLLLSLSIVSCELDFTEEKEDPKKELVFSEIDGQEYQEALDQGGARAVTSLVLLGYVEEVYPEMITMVADSMFGEDSLWRNRHYEAISMYNETYDDIPPSLHYKFGIAIFNMLMYHPNEVLYHFDSASVLELDFWNDRLKEEIQYKVKTDSIPVLSMIAMAHDHCNACDSTELNTIETMLQTLYTDF
jgi:hypothetical protein